MFKMDLRLFGKKGSTQVIQQPASVPNPTAEEKEMQKLTLDFAKQTAPNAIALNQKGSNMLLNNPGVVPVDYTKFAQQGVGQAQGLQQQLAGLAQGQVNPAFQQAREETIRRGVNNTVGGLMSNLGQRGVLNSSVTNRAMQGINDSVAEQMNRGFMDDIAAQSNLLEQRRGMLTMPMEIANAAQNASIDIPGKIFALSTGQAAPSTDAWKQIGNWRHTMASPAQAHVVQQEGSGGFLGALGQGAGMMLGKKWF